MAVFSMPSFIAIASAVYISRQPIGVLRHDLDGLDPIGLVDPHRPRRTDAVAPKKLSGHGPLHALPGASADGV